MRRYLEVWRLRGAPVLLLCGFIGRFPIAMVPLALLLLVQQRTGSYASAGLATGAYTVSTAVFAPVMGRLVDRLGPRPVLLISGSVYPVSVLALLAALQTAAPIGVVYALASASGASFPVLSSSLRSLWSQVAAGDEAVRSAAYALDSVMVETVFVSGPVTVALLVAFASPAIALAAAAALALGGTLAVAWSGPAGDWRRHPAAGSSGRFGPLRAPGMAVLLVSASAVMFGFGVMDVAVPAFAGREGRAALSGVLLGVWAVGSVSGGIWFGTRTFSIDVTRLWRRGLLAVAVGMTPLALAGNPWFLGVFLFFAGTAIAPMMTVQNGLVAAFAPPGTITEAFTWLTTVAFGASAIGSAIGGAVVELPGGVAAAFALAAAAPAIAWLIASFAPGRPGVVRAGVSETPSFAHDTPAPPASEGRGLEAGSGARGSGGLVPIGSAEPGGAA